MDLLSRVLCPQRAEPSFGRFAIVATIVQLQIDI